MAIVHLSDAAVNAMADALADLHDAGAGSGTIKIYTDTMPATPAIAVTTQTLLATLTFSATAYGDAASGTITAAAIASDASADDTGTATWARIEDSDNNVIMDVDVGESDDLDGFGNPPSLVLNSSAITVGGEVAVSSLTITMPNGID